MLKNLTKNLNPAARLSRFVFSVSIGRVVVLVQFALLSLAGPSMAAVDPIGYDNAHIYVTDPDAARSWYVEYLGGVEKDGLVYFGDTYVRFIQTEEVRPSAGSVIDHIGLSFNDLDAVMSGLEDSGATVLNPVREIPGLFRLAFIEDPWGVKFELVEDPEWPGFHHVHLRVPDPATTLAWYEEHIGGSRELLKGRLDGLRYGGVWLLASRSSEGESPVPSGNRAIMNVAFEVNDATLAAEELKATGIELVNDVRPFQNLRYAFFNDPDGVRLEVLHYED